MLAESKQEPGNGGPLLAQTENSRKGKSSNRKAGLSFQTEAEEVLLGKRSEILVYQSGAVSPLFTEPLHPSENSHLVPGEIVVS